MDFVYTLSHYLYPQYSNNHKAKVIHTSGFLLLTIFFVFVQVFISFLPKTGVSTLGYAANISSSEVIKLTNEKRTQSGLSALTYNPSLAQAAAAKANHMLQNDYWAHVAPDGTEPWKFFTDFGYKYRYAGENLARDFTNPQSVVDAWMASQSHKENLLSSKYTEIGVAVVEGDLGGVEATIVVQLFGNPLGGTTPPQLAAAQVASPTPTTPPPATPTTAPIGTSMPTVTPTSAPLEVAAIVTPMPPADEAPQLVTLPPAEAEASRFQMLVSPFQTTRGISLVVTGVLLLVLAVDVFVVARRRIPRFGGKTFAHLAFLGMIFAVVLIAKAGDVL